jgi:hypothetical protein
MMAELKPTSVTVINAVLTLRQYAAIHLCVPDSGDADLDAMIRRAQRERLAGKIAIGWLIRDRAKPMLDYPDDDDSPIADQINAAIEAGEIKTFQDECYEMADAVIAAGEGKHE